MFAPKVAKVQTTTTASSTSKLAPQRSTLATRPFGSAAGMLQQSIGNQATLRLLSQRGFSPTGKESRGNLGGEAEQANMTAREAPRGASWDFSKIPVFSPDRTNRRQASSSPPQLPLPGIIQPKLVVGRVDDPLEREADAVADRVMRMSDPALSISSGPPEINRKCAECEEEDKKLQTKPAGTVSPVRHAPPIVHEVLREPGQPLAAETRRMMESRFTRAFGDVRVHKDPRAADSAAAVNALAYTVGRHVVFGDGQFAPETMTGQRLLAHELAHVVQQSGGAAGQVQRDETPAQEISWREQARNKVPYGQWTSAQKETAEQEYQAAIKRLNSTRIDFTFYDSDNELFKILYPYQAEMRAFSQLRTSVELAEVSANFVSDFHYESSEPGKPVTFTARVSPPTGGDVLFEIFTLPSPGRQVDLKRQHLTGPPDQGNNFVTATYVSPNLREGKYLVKASYQPLNTGYRSSYREVF